MQASAGDSPYDILISESRTKPDKLISKVKKECEAEDFQLQLIGDHSFSLEILRIKDGG